MKAIVVEEGGKSEDFKEAEVDVPEVNRYDVLIEVHTTSVNPVDNAIRLGKMPFSLDSPMILTSDISGVVTKVGEDVTTLSEGDEVLASNTLDGAGGLGEFISLPAKYVAKKPEKVSFEDAAGIGLAALTAYQLVNKESLEVKKGDTVFIQGGSGGVGTYAVQFAKQNGAHVIASTSRNEGLLRELGADEVVNYKEVDIPEKFADKADVLIDTAGKGTETLPVVKRGGRALTPATPISEEEAAKRDISIDHSMHEKDSDQLRKFADQVENGELRVVIDETFPYTAEGVKKAIELSESGHASGKIVIKLK